MYQCSFKQIPANASSIIQRTSSEARHCERRLQNSILSGFMTSRLRILWSLCRQPLLAFRLLLVPLPFGSRLRAATRNFETRANANCTHRSCEVCCCAHNNHRLCKQTASCACEACSCLAGFIRSLSCHSPYACSAPRRKYDLSCSDIVYRHKTPSKKNDRNETRFRAQSPKRKRHKP